MPPCRRLTRGGLGPPMWPIGSPCLCFHLSMLPLVAGLSHRCTLRSCPLVRSAPWSTSSSWPLRYSSSPGSGIHAAAGALCYCCSCDCYLALVLGPVVWAWAGGGAISCVGQQPTLAACALLLAVGVKPLLDQDGSMGLTEVHAVPSFCWSTVSVPLVDVTHLLMLLSAPPHSRSPGAHS
jgi:hypothetical protein